MQSCSVVSTCVQPLIPLLNLELFKDTNCEFYVFVSLLEHKPDMWHVIGAQYVFAKEI